MRVGRARARKTMGFFKGHLARLICKETKERKRARKRDGERAVTGIIRLVSRRASLVRPQWLSRVFPSVLVTSSSLTLLLHLFLPFYPFDSSLRSPLRLSFSLFFLVFLIAFFCAVVLVVALSIHSH